MKHSVNIDSLRIATPCPMGWEQMTGNDRVRFCDQCGLNVYNIAELSRTEAEALIASSEGRICARLFRRVDGTVLTKDCPVGLQALRMRVSKKVAAIFAAVVSLSSGAFGQQSSAKDGKTACTPQVRISRASTQSDSDSAVVSGTLFDPIGAVVPGASVTATNLDTKQAATTTSNDDGKFEFKSLAAGSYSITFRLLGFKSHTLTKVSVEKDQLTSLDVILEVNSGTVTVGIVVESSLIETTPGTMIINEPLIRRLPIPK